MAGSPDVLSGTFAGRYTIERELGSGATATVYLARDTQRGISVAVKLLRPELAQSVGADRFLREIRLNEKLHHPHIVPVLDSGEHDGRLYFVLPHMEDGSLRQMLQREKQLPIETAIAITRTIAQALDYAHQQNLIHRDVKPENILFTSGQACLADFGIARAVERAIDESTTDTGMVRGTPAYMSPEQASGSRQYDGRSDQYSLACVLYEMLAGVPAFIGPTPEAVIAQRFQHAPRELRVYRPTTPAAIEVVIQKALAMGPADRFATTAEFSSALEIASRPPSVEYRRASGPTVGITRNRAWALVGALVIIASLIGTAVVAGLGGLGGRLTPADSTRYAILPIEADSTLPASEAYDRLHAAFSRWSGIELASRFDVRDAHGSERPVISDDDAMAIARQLRAGRYVRARLARAGTGFTLTAVLSDAVAQRRLMEISTSLDDGLARSTVAFDRLARGLLLRRADSVSATTRVLPAAQLYLAGVEALRAFRLRAADSLLSEAVELDRSFAAAALWLAQARAWQTSVPGADTWLPWAQRAATSSALSEHDHSLAVALVALGSREFSAACAQYRSLIGKDDRDFTAWYGLGQCLHADQAVVRDSRTASGWRFRSSYQQAVLAYTRAFELAPATLRNFEPRAFSQLRTLLFAGGAIVRGGHALPPDSTHFFAQAAWAGDSLLFVPYPSTVFRSGAIAHDPVARARATLAQQRLFARIARSWSAAFPRNASAKEAVAVALEMVGNPAALDTLTLARRLADDRSHQLRLASEEVLMRVSLARQFPAVIEGAAALADSLLRAPALTREDAAVLAPVAALRGQCALAGALAARASLPAEQSVAPTIPQSISAAAESLMVVAAMNCAGVASAPFDDLTAAAAATAVNTERIELESDLFARAYALIPGLDSARLGRVARHNGDYILTAQYDVERGDSTAVRRALETRRRNRGTLGTTNVTPDAVLPEMQLLLTLGDSAGARAWPDPMLQRASLLELLLNEPISAGSLLEIARLRVELAAKAGEPAVQERWNSILREVRRGSSVRSSSPAVRR
jgi:serine/threonine-protein kinase